jgi:hypothetical protein
VILVLIGYAREGDTIVVWRLDRLGRNMQDLIQIVNTLNERGVGFHSSQENLTRDKSNATGQLMFHLFAAFVFVNMKGYAQESVVRLRYSTGHSNEIPWFVREVPTVCVSLNYTTHLIDLPMMKTYISAYAPTRTVIRETIKKIMGESKFKGKHNDTLFCSRWDTGL